MKKGDVGMAKRFSKKYRHKGWAINYVQSKNYVKMPVNTWCYIPTSLHQEQAAKTNVASMVYIQVFSSMHSCTVKKKACNAHQIWCATFVPTGTPYMAWSHTIFLVCV